MQTFFDRLTDERWDGADALVVLLSLIFVLVIMLWTFKRPTDSHQTHENGPRTSSEPYPHNNHGPQVLKGSEEVRGEFVRFINDPQTRSFKVYDWQDEDDEK